MAARTAKRQMEAGALARLREKATDPHASHHEHLDGAAVYCSCGEFRGVVSVAIDDPESLASQECSTCGKPGVVGPLEG